MIEGTQSSLSDLLFELDQEPGSAAVRDEGPEGADATQAVETAQQLLDLSNRDRDKISGIGRAAASTLQVHRALMQHPIATSGSLVENAGITPATVNKALGHLERLGIVKELTGRKRNRQFSYAGYIEIMSRGTELPDK